MTDFLLELRSEEIPARMQAKAREDLARLFAAELAKSGLAATETPTYATPRRLALIARGLPQATQAIAEETKGPRANAPPQALEGFLRKTGLTREQLTERDGVLYAVTEKPGRATATVLAEAIPAIVRAFPWPKSMRWGAASASTESLRWVRPLHGVVALFGDTVVPCEIAGIASGATTLGHRFHHPGKITIGSASDYVEKLRACHVIVDQAERAALIRDRAAALAAEAGLELVEDEGLVAENAGLTEWPVPLLGRFDEAFLDVPPEVIQLTARVNQKYFVCTKSAPLPAREGLGVGARPAGSRSDAAAEASLRSAPTPDPSLAGRGGLANAFVCTANIDATDGGATIVEGNRKVLAARLSDARFFYETDLKVPLEDQAKKLDRIVFHEKLGTVADKVDRVAKLARWLVEEGIVKSSPFTGRGTGEAGGGGPATSAAQAHSPLHHASGAVPLPVNGEDLAALAERGARLAKADLVTGMVGEFPELQGVMGGYYAAAQGEDLRIAAAIRDHYKPVGQGDEVPTDPVTVAVSLADKLDTLVGFYIADEKPSGSRDPFALRRAAIGVVRLLVSNNLSFSINTAVWEAGRSVSSFMVGNMHGKQARVIEDAMIAAEIAKPGAYAEAYWRDVLEPAIAELAEQAMVKISNATFELSDFFADRLKVQQREAGVRHDLIDAVFALGGEDDLVRLLARVHALQAFIGTADGANLLAGYKRAANILKKEGYEAPLPAREGLGVGARPEGSRCDAAAEASLRSAPTPDPSLAGRGDFPLSYTPEKDEAAIIAALDAAEPAAADAVRAEDFEAAMAALATLRAPIDAFFESVTVNDPDEAKRAARLALLARVRAAVHTVADFSKIEG